MLQPNTGVLTLAHQGTGAVRSRHGQAGGQTGQRRRTPAHLSQRMAMLYLEAKLPMDTAAATAEIEKARAEYVTACPATLHKASETTTRIQDELQLADSQWVFFDAALEKGGNG